MKFGLDKFGVLTMKSGKELEGDGIVIENIGPIGEEEYKYFVWRKGIYVKKRWKKTLGKNAWRGWNQHWN